LCCLFGKSRTAYYKATKRKIKNINNEYLIIQDVLKIRIKQPKIGTKKLYHILKTKIKKQNINYGRDKFYLLLKANKLTIKPKKNYIRTTHSHPWIYGFGNQIENLLIIRPEQVWVSDITYIKTTNGYKYLSLVTDAYSRKIMRYFLSEDLKTQGTVKALEMALQNRIYNLPIIHHSDKGVQYCSKEYTNILRENNISSSTTTNGDPYQNAIAERVNGILKQEFLFNVETLNMTQALKLIKKSIKIYNELRPHWSISLDTPNKVHNNIKFKYI